ncbi:MAG: four helix bundle protein [Bacteroidia bacterium]
MERRDLEDRLIEFASSVLDACKHIDGDYAINHLKKQLIRSSTSAALNYGEAQVGESTADFIHKLRISLKELKESFICLRLLIRRPALSDLDLEQIKQENNELIAIFIASIRTASGGFGRNNKK